MRILTMPRYQFTPFWQLTNWGLLRGQTFRTKFGCDEFHNKSRYWIIPFVGCFVIFAKGGTRLAAEHVYALSPAGVEGRVVPGCDICGEIVEAFSCLTE